MIYGNQNTMKKLEDGNAYIFNESKKALSELTDLRLNLTKSRIIEWQDKYWDLWSLLHSLITSGVLLEFDYTESSIWLFYDGYNEMTLVFDELSD